MTNTLAYLALVVACVGGALAASPVVLYATALFLPWLQVMPRPLGMPSAAPNVVLGALVVLAMRGGAKPDGKGAGLPMKRSIVFMAIVLLLGVAIRFIAEKSGTTFSNDFADQPMLLWYWVTPFVVYALVWRIATDPAVATRTIRLCELSVAGEGVLTMLERAMGVGRATAHLGEPNRAGAYFAAGACYFLGRILSSRGRMRLYYVGAWIFTIGGVFNSLSRGALVATVLGSLVTTVAFFLKAKGRGGTKLVFVVVLLVLLANAAVVIPQSVIDRVNSTFGGSDKETVVEGEMDSSAQARLLFWGIAWDTFKVRPFGVGAGTFPSLTEPYWDRPMNAHNIYLQLLTEYGLQGLLALVILIVAALRYCYGTYARGHDGPRGETALSLLGWWTAHCVAHFFVNPFFMLAVNGHFWMMLACMAHLSSAAPAVPAAQARPS